jgi:hypothetical protein
MKTPMESCSLGTTTLQEQILFHGGFCLVISKGLKKTHTKKFQKIVAWPLHDSILFTEKHCFTNHNGQV